MRDTFSELFMRIWCWDGRREPIAAAGLCEECNAGRVGKLLEMCTCDARDLVGAFLHSCLVHNRYCILISVLLIALFFNSSKAHLL